VKEGLAAQLAGSGSEVAAALERCAAAEAARGEAVGK
jgi:hypothetical protein